MLILWTLIYGIKCLPKSQQVLLLLFYYWNWQANSKTCMEMQRAKNNQYSLEEQKTGGFTLPDTEHKCTGTKTNRPMLALLNIHTGKYYF